MTRVVFPSHADDFRSALKRSVDQYFAENRLRERDSPYMYAKALFFIALLASSYVVLVFYSLNAWVALAAAFLVGTAMWGIGFNVMHDGNHDAFSSRPWINRAAGFWLDILGASRFYWDGRHNQQHHTYTGIVGHDCDIEHSPLARLSKDHPWRWYHRYQHLYMWTLYSLVHIGFVYGDFQRLIQQKNGTESGIAPKGWDLVEFLVGKVIYFTFALVIPMFFHPWWEVLIFYAGISLYTGFVLGVIGQLAHEVEEVEQPGKVEGTNIVDWTRHQISTSAGFATDSRLCLFLFGGLNCQPFHHVFARIAHAHYPKLTKVMHRVCDEYGVRYYDNPTLWSAIRSHYRLLRALGQAA